MPSFLKALDVLVLPSVTIPPLHREQFGRVLVEAMAAGVPVIGSSSGAIPEVIGDAGLVVPEGDPRALAAAIDQVLGDPALRQRLVERGRQRVATRFAWPVVAEQTCELFRSAIVHRRRVGHAPRGGARMRRVAVTGGAGFIGSNLVDALLERGDDVLVIDNLSTGKRANLNPAASVAELDIAVRLGSPHLRAPRPRDRLPHRRLGARAALG